MCAAGSSDGHAAILAIALVHLCQVPVKYWPRYREGFGGWRREAWRLEARDWRLECSSPQPPAALARIRPDRALVLRVHRGEALVDELLETLSFVGFRRVDVPLRVDGDAVYPEPLAGVAAAITKAREVLHRGTLDDVDPVVLAVGDIDKALLRVLREGDVPDRAGGLGVLRQEGFVDVRAVRFEHLDAIVDAVADVEQAVVRQIRAVHRVAELLGRRRGRIIGAQRGVIRLRAVRAPV